MSGTMSKPGRIALALLFAGGGGAVGFLEGRALADGRLAPKGWFAGERARPAKAPAPEAAPVAPRVSASLRELFAALAEVPFPSAGGDPVEWRAALAVLARLSASHGFATDLASDDATLARCVALGAPVEVAAFLDLWSEVAERAGSAVVRDAATRIAARLDGDPVRSRVRAALLARDRGRVLEVVGEVDAADLDAATAALLGAALLRTDADDDALAQWRAGALEHPDDPVLHLLLAWRLEDAAVPSPAAAEEARGHVAAAAALLPESEALRQRAAASNR